LIAAIPESSLTDSAALAAEAARRQLAAAVPALAALCRRFSGFGSDRIVPEQAAALRGLAMIGGREAAYAISRIIEQAVVRGPALNVAVSAAAQLGSRLSLDTLRALLRHAEPGVRAEACRCVRPAPELIALLVDLFDDLDRTVAKAPACALGRMGRTEARPLLKRWLRDAPCEDVVEAASSVADAECVVLLGRIARSTSGLADAARDALEEIDHPDAGAPAGTRLPVSHGRPP
jgi:hypothetical protein